MKVLSLILFCLGFCGPLYASDLDYSLSSSLAWRSEGDLIVGELDNYTLVDDEAVKALIGIKDGTSFFQELTLLTDEDIRSKFLSGALLFDPLNRFKDRKVSQFKVLRDEDRIRIVLNYEFAKDSTSFREMNVFDVQQKGMAFATVMVPHTTSPEVQSTLEKDVSTFELVINKQGNKPGNDPSDKKMHAYRSTPFSDSIQDPSIKDLATRQLYQALSGISLATPAWASDSNSCEVERNQYISDGNWSDKEGSATFRFEQLVRDLKQEARSKQTRTEKFSCLSKILNESMQNSVKYWRARGLRTGCLTESGFPEKKPAGCSEINWQKLNNNIQYFDKIRTDILTLTTKDSRKSSNLRCETKTQPQKSDLFMTIKTELERSRVRTCCYGVDETPMQKSQLGPLAQVINSDARLSFSKWTPEARFNECVSRTRETKQEFFSKDGVSSCAENAFHGAVQALKTMWSGLSSIFSAEGLKQIWHFLTNLPESGNRLVAMIADHIGREASAVTQCMNSYQKAQYTCQMIGSIASSILGPRYLLKFLKLIATSSKVTELKALIAEAAEANPVSKNALDIARKSKDSVKNAKEKIGEKIDVLLDNPAGEAIRKLGNILTSDINAPMRELLARGATNAASATRAAATATGNAARAAYKKLSKQSELDTIKNLADDAAKTGATEATSELAKTPAKLDTIKTPTEQAATNKPAQGTDTSKAQGTNPSDPTAQASSQNSPIANNQELKRLRAEQSSLTKVIREKPTRTKQSLNDLKKRASDVQQKITATQRLAKYEKSKRLKEKAKQTLIAARDFLKSIVGEIAKRELSANERELLAGQRRYLDDLEREINPATLPTEPIEITPPIVSTPSSPKPTGPDFDPKVPQFPSHPDPIDSSAGRETILDPTGDSRSIPTGDSSRPIDTGKVVLHPSPRNSTNSYGSTTGSPSAGSSPSVSFNNPSPSRAPTWQNSSGTPSNTIQSSGVKEPGKTNTPTATKTNNPMKPEAPPATPKDVGVNGEFDANLATDIRKQISQEPLKARTALENELEDLNIEAQNLSVGISVGGYSDLIKAKMKEKLKRIENRRTTIDHILDEGDGQKTRRHKKFEAPKEFVARPPEQRAQLVNNYTRIIRGAGLAYFAEEIQRLNRQEAELRAQREVSRKADLKEPGNQAILNKVEMQLQQSVDAIASLKEAKTLEESRSKAKAK